MKRIICVLTLALSALSLPALHSATAQTDGQSADGTFRFMSEDGVTRYVEFTAVKDREGATTGSMLFHDPSQIPDDDSDDDPPPDTGDWPREFYLKADFDDLTVEKNRAVMDGVIVDSTHRSYIGRWVQLVVEDSGEDPKLPDQVSWQICKPEAGGWVPSDAELAYDDGAYLSWWATDAERKDDVGIPSRNLIPGLGKGCYRRPFAAYSFFDMYRWEGNIVVRPF